IASVYKFDQSNSAVTLFFDGKGYENGYAQILIDKEEGFSILNFGDNSSVLRLYDDSIANIFNGTTILPSWSGCISQDGKKWIYINKQGVTENPIAYIVDSYTKNVIDTIPISFDPNPAPVLNRIATNFDGSVLVAISSVNGSSYNPQTAHIISLTGAFPPKSILTQFGSRDYGWVGSVCINPEGTTAFLFDALNLYTLNISSGDLQVIPNYASSDQIESINILSTSLIGKIKVEQSTWQTHRYSTLNWYEIFDPKKIEVYRDGEKIGELPGSARSFEDHSLLLENKTYEYTVNSVWDNGQTSNIGTVFLETNGTLNL
ncbi:MAG: hypothetical protein ACOYK9_06035, partial [Chlamydiia bacterium]